MSTPDYQHLIDLAKMNGVVEERNRVLRIILEYKEAGWIDAALAHLLAEDICPQEEL